MQEGPEVHPREAAGEHQRARQPDADQADRGAESHAGRSERLGQRDRSPQVHDGLDHGDGGRHADPASSGEQPPGRVRDRGEATGTGKQDEHSDRLTQL